MLNAVTNTYFLNASEETGNNEEILRAQTQSPHFANRLHQAAVVASLAPAALPEGGIKLLKKRGCLQVEILS